MRFSRGQDDDTPILIGPWLAAIRRLKDGVRHEFGRCLCVDPRMKFKTISLSEDAYKILKKARRSRRESFTEVVRRASWDEPADTMGEALDLLESEFDRGKTTGDRRGLTIVTDDADFEKVPQMKRKSYLSK